MSSKSTGYSPAPCNRRPFASDDGCDRGSVDIHQFDDLPYCGTIDPTMPEIPPEIVDTPLDVVIPPSCVCFNVEQKVDFRYSGSRQFKSEASFAAQGDCCDGNYVSTLDLQIPCPVVGGGSKKLSVRLGYGTGGSKASQTYIKANASSCTVEAEDVDIKLTIPCPVPSVTKRLLTVGISYGNGKSELAASFIKTDAKKCTIEPLATTLRLNIPCPLVGVYKQPPQVMARVKYGSSGGWKAASYMKVDPQECTFQPVSPSIDLQLPCPVKDDGPYRMTVGISYGTARRQSYSASFIKTDPRSCIITPLSPKIRLQIPCPVRLLPNRLKIGASIGWGSSGQAASASLLTVDTTKCTVSEVKDTLKLQLPCPFPEEPPRLHARIGWGDDRQSASVGLFEVDRSACSITQSEEELQLQLPCPLQNFRFETEYQTIQAGEQGEFIAEELNADDPGESNSAQWVTDRCSRAIKLTVKVPQPDVSSINITCGSVLAPTKTQIGIAPYFSDANSSYLLDVLEAGSCTVNTVGTVKDGKTYKQLIAVPCPTKSDYLTFTTKYESGSTGGFSYSSSYDITKCKRTINLTMRARRSDSAKLSKKVVTDIRYANHKLEVELTDFSGDAPVSNWKTVFTAISHMSDHTCCADVNG